jgi:hypothetical protein
MIRLTNVTGFNPVEYTLPQLWHSSWYSDMFSTAGNVVLVLPVQRISLRVAFETA